MKINKKSTSISVIHIITRLIHGGADENTLTSCKHLSKRGWHVILVVGKECSHDLNMLKESGIEVIQLPSLIRSISLLKDLKATYQLFKLCKECRPSIVHTHTAKAGVVGRVAARLARVPVVIHGVHGSPFDSVSSKVKQKLLAFVERLTSPFNDYYISVGEEIFEKYCRQIKIKTDAYSVARSAFDVERFVISNQLRKKARIELGYDDNDIVIGKIGRVAPQKGYQYFIELCSKLAGRDQRFKYLSVGRIDDESYYEELKKAASRDSLEKIEFAGQVDASEVPKYIAAMDLVVHTALWEGLPRAVVEALVANKPVIAFEVEGVSEVIEHGVNGFIVPPGDVQAMERAVFSLVDGTGLKEFASLAKKKNETLREEFKIEKMIDVIENTYHMILQKQAR